ncbi:MAG: cytochrome P450 [Microbacterium sp.]
MTDANTSSRVAEDFSTERSGRFALPTQYQRALASMGAFPVRLWNGETMNLVARYEEVRQVLTSQAFSAVPTAGGYPIIAPTYAALAQEKANFLQQDDPGHQHFRRMIAPMFTAPKVERLRPRFQAILRDLYDDMERKGAPFNFFQDFALVFPSIVICELVGIPFEHMPVVHESTKVRLDLSADRETVLAAGRRSAELMKQLIDERLRVESGTDDLMGYLVEKHLRPGTISPDDAVAILQVVAQAGHETTANAIAVGTYVLLTQPHQGDKLRKDPTLSKTAVEEILRYTNIPQVAVLRAAKEDVQVGETTYPQGSGVMASIISANHDPEIFESPDDFDIERSPNPHLTFTTGIHACLGQGVARLELNLVFETLFERFPDLRLAVPAEEIRFREDSKAYGVWELPVEW